MKKILFCLLFICCFNAAKSQVLISLLLGDKLNSPNLEFGLDGGVNLGTIQGLHDAERFTGFNLGFYFDIKLFKNKNWMFNTGVIVKSPHGAEDLPVYSLNNTALDSVFVGGKVARKLRYFNVPLAMKYTFKNRIFVKGGVMLGLRYRCFDEFTNEIEEEDDLKFEVDIKDKFHPIDAGGYLGVGYRLMGGNGMNLGVQYYHGFVDITIDDSGSNEYNDQIYFTVGIPIGKGKAAEKAKAKEVEEQK